MPIDALRCLRARACFFVFLLFGSEPQAQQNECERDRKEQAGVGGEKEETDGSTSKPHNTTKANAQQLAPGRTQLNDANDAAHQHASPRSMSEERKRITKRRRRPPKHSQHAHTHSRTLSENPSRLVVAAPPNTAGVKQQITPQDPFSVFLAEKQPPETPSKPPSKKKSTAGVLYCVHFCVHLFLFLLL